MFDSVKLALIGKFYSLKPQFETTKGPFHPSPVFLGIFGGTFIPGHHKIIKKIKFLLN